MDSQTFSKLSKKCIWFASSNVNKACLYSWKKNWKEIYPKTWTHSTNQPLPNTEVCKWWLKTSIVGSIISQPAIWVVVNPWPGKSCNTQNWPSLPSFLPPSVRLSVPSSIRTSPNEHIEMLYENDNTWPKKIKNVSRMLWGAPGRRDEAGTLANSVPKSRHHRNM